MSHIREETGFASQYDSATALTSARTWLSFLNCFRRNFAIVQIGQNVVANAIRLVPSLVGLASLSYQPVTAGSLALSCTFVQM